jgi:hypothetical protein
MITHRITTPGRIAGRYLGTGTLALRREFHRAGLPAPRSAVQLVRLALLWLEIQGHEHQTVERAAFALGMNEADASNDLYRLTGFRPTAARHTPLAAMLDRWARRIVPVPAPAAGGQLLLFGST